MKEGQERVVAIGAAMHRGSTRFRINPTLGSEFPRVRSPELGIAVHGPGYDEREGIFGDELACDLGVADGDAG